jgi:hypothetical protein
MLDKDDDLQILETNHFFSQRTVVEYCEHLCTAIDQSKEIVRKITDLVTVVSLHTEECFTISQSREQFFNPKEN